jgi:hypothetical protein
MLSAEHRLWGRQLALYRSNPQDWNPWAEAALSTVEPTDGAMILDLTGPPGTREFVAALLES